MSLLQLDQATIKFGGLIAVNGVSFELNKGELFGLIGPNGAGKTTVFNLITGVYAPTSGAIRFNDRQIAVGNPRSGCAAAALGPAISLMEKLGLTPPRRTPPYKIARLGIARTFQNIRLFRSMSVLENVVVGGLLRHRTPLISALAYLPPAIKETERLKEEALGYLRIVELDHVANVRSADLAYGMQRRLEIARAMATHPQLLLLDEPAAGMNPQEKADLNGMVRKIRDEQGLTVLLIEHDMRFVMSLCERIVVLDHGEEIAHGPPAEIRNDPKVIAAYLGEAV